MTVALVLPDNWEARPFVDWSARVARACAANDLAVVIPCHRVVGHAGLGGFSAPGGIETKVALLRHEGAYSLLI